MHSINNNLNVLYLEHNKTLKHKTTEKVFHGQFKSPFNLSTIFGYARKKFDKDFESKIFSSI